MESFPKEIKNQILFINFNQDFNCFCVGTEEGYIICNAENYKSIFHRSNSIIYNIYNFIT